MIEIRVCDMVNTISARSVVYERRFKGYCDLKSVNPYEFGLMKAPIHNHIQLIENDIGVYSDLLEVMTFDDNTEYRSVVDQINRMRTIKRKLSELIY